MSTVNTWIQAARLRTLPLAFSSIITGAALAMEHQSFDPIVFSLALLTTLCLQVLSNYANDLGDFVKGTDDDSRVGPSRALQSGAISLSAMRSAVIVMSIISLISGLSLLYFSGLRVNAQGLLFFALGLVAIWAAISYTAGSRPYGYAGLGDLSVFLFFGLLGVLGSSYLHSLSIPFKVDVLAAATIGFWSAGVLNLNNMRDAVPDQAAGKLTMAVKLGRRPSRVYHAILIGLGLVCLYIYIWQTAIDPLDYLALATTPLVIMQISRVSKYSENRELDPELKRLALTTFLLSLLLLVSRYF